RWPRDWSSDVCSSDLVYRLLGGPLRDAIPAYASALGYAVEPEAAAQRARELVAQGYRATKWFFRHGPGDGEAGMAKNVDLARAQIGRAACRERGKGSA